MVDNTIEETNNTQPNNDRPNNSGYLTAYLEELPKSNLFLKSGTTSIPDDAYFNDNKKMRNNNQILYDIPDSEIKEYDKSTDRTIIREKKWHTDALQDFLQELDELQDPTYLGFELIFVADESPLFNYDQGGELSDGKHNSALKFIQTYYNIPDVYFREAIIIEFLANLKQMFHVFTNATDNQIVNKRHYVEMITGLEKLTDRIVKYEESFIEVQLTEDVSLRTQYLADLYNNLLYDYRTKRYMLPENTLRFDLLIKIKDIRDIKVSRAYDDGSVESTFLDSFRDTFTIYKLHDCNFDFVTSQSHEDTIKMSGWSTFDTGNMNNLKFKIKYKSISKVTKTDLITRKPISKMVDTHNLSSLSTTINNEANMLDESRSATQMNNNETSSHDITQDSNNIYQSDVETREENPSPDVGLSDPKNINDEKDKHAPSREKELSSEKNRVIKDDFRKKIKEKNPIKELGLKKLDDLKKIGDKVLRNVTNGIKGKLSAIRGALITDLKKDIYAGLGYDRLGNVYSTNFRQMSIENFAKNLATDVIESALDSSELMDLTNVSIKAPTIDGGFSQPRTAFSKNDYLGAVNKSSIINYDAELVKDTQAQHQANVDSNVSDNNKKADMNYPETYVNNIAFITSKIDSRNLNEHILVPDKYFDHK